MITNNNAELSHSQSSQSSIEYVTLPSVKEAMNSWRLNKKTRGEKIPEHLWDLVLQLLNSNFGSESKILAELNIKKPQLEAEKQRRQRISSMVNKKSESLEQLDFCEVTKVAEPSYPLAYKPAESFSTQTSVVEIYRKDGALMKIHICTERFDELLRAFLNGGQ